jgi:hypothetical protein
MFLRLVQEWQWFLVEFFFEKFEKDVLVVLPLEPVFGVADLKSIEVEFPEDSLVPVAIGFPKQVFWAVGFVRAALNEALAAEERKSCEASACGFPNRGKALCSLPLSEVEVDIFAP